MRALQIAIAVVTTWLAGPAAFAKPKVAIVPIQGDASDQVGAVLRDAMAGKAVIVPPRDVARAAEKLGLSGELDERDAQRLRTKLGASVIVHGKLGRAGKKKALKVVVVMRGQPASDFDVQFKTASPKFRAVVREALLKRLDGAPEPEAEAEEAAPAPPPRVAKRAPEPEPEPARPAKKKKKKRAAAGADAEVSASADDDDDEPRPRKRKKRRGGDDDEEIVSSADVIAARARVHAPVRVDAGLAVGVRRLVYTAVDTPQRPPNVGTGAAAGRLEAELYPFKLAGQRGGIAGLGLVAEYEKTFGLSIDVPNTSVSTPIDQARLAVGARYRIAAGPAAIGLELRYATRHYIADRSALMNPAQLDTPDVEYKAIAPGASVRAAVSSKVALAAQVSGLLVLGAGEIQEPESYGRATAFGLDARAGFDVALAKKIALRVVGEYAQINMTFTGTGALASSRSVSAATEQQFGLAATLAAMF